MSGEDDVSEGLSPGAIGGLALAVEHYDRPLTGEAKMLDTFAGTYSGRQMIGAKAGVTVVKGRVAASAFEVSVNGPSLGAGVSVGLLNGLCVGTTVEFTRVEARSPFGSVATGLNLNSRVTINPITGGVGAKILGFGLDIGWSGIKISCPILEIGIGMIDGGDD